MNVFVDLERFFFDLNVPFRICSDAGVVADCPIACVVLA